MRQEGLRTNTMVERKYQNFKLLYKEKWHSNRLMTPLKFIILKLSPLMKGSSGQHLVSSTADLSFLDTFHRKTIVEEHIALISEPGSKYCGHLRSLGGDACKRSRPACFFRSFV